MSGKPSAGRSPRPHAQAAYTLVELLVAMAVLSVAFAAFAALLGVLIRHSGETQERSTLQTEARAAIDRLVQDLRQGEHRRRGDAHLEPGQLADHLPLARQGDAVSAAANRIPGLR